MGGQASDDVFRRRIRLIATDTHTVVAGVEDDFHAFGVRLTHDGQRVLSLTGDAVRYPLDTCPGATALLSQAQGLPLSPDCRDLGRYLDPRQHCTHLFDLAGLAMAHACRDEPMREYDIAIPESSDDRTMLYLRRNGQSIMSLRLDGPIIASPSAYAGQSIEHGFSTWAQQQIVDLDEREALLVLARARFVSAARKHRDQIQQTPTPWRHVPVGICYSYQPARIDRARRMADSIRDFSDEEGDMLAFLDTSRERKS